VAPSARSSTALADAGEFNQVAVSSVGWLKSLAESPHRVGKSLKLGLQGLHSARRGDYRVIYRIDDDARMVAVMAIEHRSDIYRSRQF
jgi:mRNA-degrading endonuclease RelE of RelBE toxin-antitoxin system